MEVIDLDPLDIMMNQEQVVPYFSPIISAENQLIIGYELKPYYEDSEKISLDWFFKDDSIPSEFRLELNTIIQQKALDLFFNKEQSTLLFINYNAKLLLNDNGETLLNLLQIYADRGLNLNRLVLELSADYVIKHIDSYKHLLAYIQTLGIRLAIDDAGNQNGNLERLAMIKPNILKVDTSFLEDDALPHLYQDVHHLLSMFSRKIGATLLFKGIETFQQLNYAWRNGGHYYQGIYFAKELPEFVATDCCKEKIKKDFHHFITFEQKKMKAQLDLTESINNQLSKSLKKLNTEDHYDKTILTIANDCDPITFRVYICNQAGYQLSSNAEKNSDGEWKLHYEGRQKNWSWRPYFFENIVRMNIEKKGILSDLYTDIERDERIRTYSFPMSEDVFIFIDIPYDFLYEQEGLL